MSKVTLESRQKLPQKVQDVICDVSLAIQHAVQASPATEHMTNTIKTMAAMDAPIENTEQNLAKIDSLLDELEGDCAEIGKNVDQVTDAMDRLQNIERHKYFCAESMKEAESDFDRSDFETNNP